MYCQEFDAGGTLLLGGLEAADEVTGANVMGVDLLVECRDGESEHRDRNGRPHALHVPAGVEWVKVRATVLTSWSQPSAVEVSYQPILDALNAGRTVLVYCLNGRHRSNQTASNIVYGGLETAEHEQTQNYVWSRRHLVDYRTFSGSPWWGAGRGGEGGSKVGVG